MTEPEFSRIKFTNQFYRAREEYLGSSLIERTSRLQSFTDLGTADLCNIYKESLTSKKHTEIGTFLYFTGVDTSNAASIAAHLQSLATLITSKAQYWFGEKKHWRVPQISYCSYNAFSKVDMRVTVHIPGKIESSVVSADGKLILDKLSKDELDNLWQETYVSSLARCLLDTEDEDVSRLGGLVEVRKLNPFAINPNLVIDSFVKGFEKLFFEGPKLGCCVEIPQPTLVNNYLVDAFLKLVKLVKNYDEALAVLARLREKEPSVVSLVAKVYFMKDEEIKAIDLVYEAIQKDKRDTNLLLIQAQFCVDKGRNDLALELAKQAVKSSPSDFVSWAMLVKVYTNLRDYENALLTLNSCPMNSHKEKFSLKRVVPLRGGGEDLHLPSPVDVTMEEVSSLQNDELAYEQRNLDPQLAGLPASNLKSTFAKAYELLTDIVIKTGWETLLKYRAKVFVMEEEYRKDKISNSKLNLAKDRKNSVVSAQNGGEDNVSTIAVKSPLRDGHNTEVHSENGEVPEPSSTKSEAVESDAAEVTTESETVEVLSDVEPEDNASSSNGDFKMKRLCERWLDNLFMLLYEDLRAYTVWQAEYVHFKAQQMEFKKTTLEWELLGQLAFRLKHFKEGSVAFSNALRGRFSARSQKEMLTCYIKERTRILARNSTSTNVVANYTKSLNLLNDKILECCIKLLVWNHRWYCDFSYTLLDTLSDLVEKEGLLRVKTSVQAQYSDVPSTHSSSSSSAGGNRGITNLMDQLYGFLGEINGENIELSTISTTTPSTNEQRPR